MAENLSNLMETKDRSVLAPEEPAAASTGMAGEPKDPVKQQDGKMVSPAAVTGPNTSSPLITAPDVGVPAPQPGQPVETQQFFPGKNNDRYGGSQDPSAPKDTGTGLETVDIEDPSPQETPSAGDQQSIRAQLESLLGDPNSFLSDRNVLQQYTDVNIYKRDESGNIVRDADGNPVLDATQFTDPSKFNIDTTSDLDTQVVAEAAPDVQVANFSAALIDPENLTKAVEELKKVDPMQAASMSEEMDKLLEGLEDGNVPVWARPAVAKVEQMLASRGISASSIGRDSLFNAIIQSAMPIAQQDAAFKQEKYKTEYGAKVQAMLSDVNMEFAAKQFNANSINQANQFKAQLQAQVDLQNAARKDAMTQFSVSESNKMGMFVEQIETQREQFNANMSAQIEQANVQWRRQVNMQNTAGLNAVNQANVQNAFNLSNQALTFLWQEMRDEAQWEWQSSENDKAHKNQLEASILANESAMAGELGATVEGILNGANAFGSFLSDLWD